MPISSNQIKHVISENLCVGCGACAIAEPSQFKIGMNDKGYYSATATSDTVSAVAAAVCPFSGVGLNEDDVAAARWPALPTHSGLGKYSETLACHVADRDDRLASGSGGLVTWLCCELLRRNEADAVVHVGLGGNGTGAIYHYKISKSVDEVRAKTKSRYYPITLDGVVQEFLGSGERVIFVGVPCFIKAMRNLIQQDIVPAHQVPQMIGLVCGHLKSRYFADYLMWQKIGSTDPETFDFREKLMDRQASDYGFTYDLAGVTGTHPMASVKAKDWGEGLFKLKACECCDDVLAECADIAIGDAWLPQFVQDPLGENIVVVRDAQLAHLIEKGRASGQLIVSPVSPVQVEKSQASGLRHRREGTSHRLARWKSAGKWAPERRVPAQLAPTQTRRAIYDLRLKISETSNDVFAGAKAAGHIADFETTMGPTLRKLKRLTYGTLIIRVWRKFQRKIGLSAR